VEPAVCGLHVDESTGLGRLMPNQPKTPNRVVRVDDALWVATQERARENGETVSAVIRRALRAYTSKPNRTRENQP
jgi:hypothetical protein